MGAVVEWGLCAALLTATAGQASATASRASAAASGRGLIYSWSDPWEVEFHGLDGNPVRLSTANTSYQISGLTFGSTLFVLWYGITHSDPNLPAVRFNLLVTIGVNAQTGLQEHFVQVVCEPGLRMRSVVYPRIEVRMDRAGHPEAGQVLSIPMLTGMLLRDPMNAISTTSLVEIHHPGQLSMQWYSYYDQADEDSPLFFFGTQDETGHHKAFKVERLFIDGERWLRFGVRHYPRDYLGDVTAYNSQLAYPVVVGELRGDWFDAARKYRSWAITTPFASAGPIKTSSEFSDLVKGAGLHGVFGVGAEVSGSTFVRFRTEDFQYLLANVQEQAQLYGSSPCPSKIYMWHNNMWGSNFGGWFPVRPEFASAGRALVANGFPYAAYLNFTVYDLGYRELRPRFVGASQ